MIADADCQLQEQLLPNLLVTRVCGGISMIYALIYTQDVRAKGGKSPNLRSWAGQWTFMNYAGKLRVTCSVG